MAPPGTGPTRRTVLIGGALAAVAGRATTGAQAASPFTDGVASGDPAPDRVVLWTRLPGADGTPVSWAIATDPEVREPVASGQAVVAAATDFTVHVDAAGLEPATTYYFAFEANGARSDIGRTRTAPAGAADHLRIAVVSCARYAAGHFNVYAALARQAVDLVVHVGDFLYEDGGAGVRAHEPPHRLVTLDDYRRRHAQQRSDPDLRELLRLHPVAAVWDDHDIAGGAWRDGARSHEPGRDGPWEDRRAAAVRAWREWLPVRTPDPGDPLRIWRRLPLGDLADLVLLDTRLYGRDQPAGPDDPPEALDDPTRSLLGDAQRAFLLDALTTGGATWQLVANQVMFAPLVLPVPPGFDDDDLRAFGLVRTGNDARNPDQWDGYTAERGRVLEAAASAGGRVVVLTGDIHSSWAWTVPTAGRPVAEVVTPNVAGDSFAEILGVSGVTADLAETALSALNGDLDHVELTRHGWLTVDITPDRVHTDWWSVPSTETRRTDADHGAARLLRHDGDTFEDPGAPADTPAAGAPPPGAPPPREPRGDDDSRTSGWLLAGLGTAAAAAGAALVALRRRRSR